jgi:hypothetical protein
MRPVIISTVCAGRGIGAAARQREREESVKKQYLWSLIVVLVLVYTSAPALGNNHIRTFVARLGGAGEVPAVATGAFGDFELILNMNTGQGDYTIRLWNSPPLTAAHIHVGGPNVAGPVIIPLTAVVAGFSGDGVFRGQIDIVRDLIPNPSRGLNSGADVDQILRINNGENLYVNLHTTQNPGGEIRGSLQFSSKLTP